MNQDNIYKEILKTSLSRLVNLYDLDRGSATLGYGDRLYWGWKTKDFVNGTFQGGVHALAVASRLELLDKERTLNIIDVAIRAMKRIRHRNGSLVEAYPNEHSFCVTALVAFDVLSALYLLADTLDSTRRDAYLSIVRPLIKFISRHDETHAVISNHLATAAAAVAYWNYLTGENNPRDRQLLEEIYKCQSAEGWYREYEGADPGYQTLCTYYLASILKIRRDNVLHESLLKSGEFLKHFIHPDGTLGGLYGSRNTEVYYPAGIVQLETESKAFQCMSSYFETAVKEGRHLSPAAIDVDNFVPLINAYAEAALIREDRGMPMPPDEKTGFADEGEKDFCDAGIYIKSTCRYFAIVNYRKGGTVTVFDKTTGELDIEDGGLYGERGSLKFSTQQLDPKNTFENRTVTSNFYRLNEDHLSPFKFIILRVLGMTVFASVAVGDVFKQWIVRRLMTGKQRVPGRIERCFNFTDDQIVVKEKIVEAAPAPVRHIGKFKTIHMASSGYNIRSLGAGQCIIFEADGE